MKAYQSRVGLSSTTAGVLIKKENVDRPTDGRFESHYHKPTNYQKPGERPDVAFPSIF